MPARLTTVAIDHCHRCRAFSKARMPARRDNSHMLRDKNLVPLSHQHQHALALCVRIERAMHSGDLGLAAFQTEIYNLFESQIEIHFQAEERFLFPSAARFAEMKMLVSGLLAEHTELRSYRLAAMARSMSRSDLLDFAATLAAHIRTEERELFEKCQRLFTGAELLEIGNDIHRFFQANGFLDEAQGSSIGAS